MFLRGAIALIGLTALAGCGRSDTGVRIAVHVGALEYDELRFRLTRAPVDPGAATVTLVDPETKGRFVAPFPLGDQSVVIYLSEALDGTAVHCEVSAWHGGIVVANGAGDVTVMRQQVNDVDIVMLAVADPPPTGTPPPDAGTPPPLRANGEGCSIGAECLSGHCADGVCCESDCQLACHSCALAQTEGLCRPVAAGTPDPRAQCSDKGVTSCQTNGLCGVAGACALYSTGSICEPAGCGGNGKDVLPARTCDGAGHCEGPPKLKCADGLICVAGVCS